MRLHPRAVLLLLALWVPQSSGALGLVVMAHGSHHVSWQSARGAVDVVLHHHAMACHDATTIGAVDHSHDDHLIRGTGDGLVAPRTELAAPDAGDLDRHAADVPAGIASLAPALAPRANLAAPLRTVVLRI